MLSKGTLSLHIAENKLLWHFLYVPFNLYQGREMRLIIMIIYDTLLQASLPVQQPKPMLCDREAVMHQNN